MADIFISHAQHDRSWVARLATILKAEGFSVWWAAEMPAGKQIDKIVRRELTAARAVIVVWSRRSVESRWVLGEADEASSLEKLTPIKMEPVQLPTQFRSIHTPDLSDWNGDIHDAQFRSLLNGIRDLALPDGASGFPSHAVIDNDKASLPADLAAWRRTRLAYSACVAVALMALALAIFEWLEPLKQPLQLLSSISGAARMTEGGGHVRTVSAGSAEAAGVSSRNDSWIGVDLADMDGGKLGVVGVVPGSPAEVAGFHLGDVITRVDGIVPGNAGELRAEVRSKLVGSYLHVDIERRGNAFSLSALLRKEPNPVPFPSNETLAGENVEEINSRCGDVSKPVEIVVGACQTLLDFTNADKKTQANWLIYLGIAFHKMGWFYLARDKYDLALNDDPKNVYALYYRGLVKYKLGNRAGGDQDMNTVRTLDPNVEHQSGAFSYRPTLR